MDVATFCDVEEIRIGAATKADVCGEVQRRNKCPFLPLGRINDYSWAADAADSDVEISFNVNRQTVRPILGLIIHEHLAELGRSVRRKVIGE